MKLVSLLLFSVLVFFGAFSLYHTGSTVTITYQQWLVELPLWIVVLALIVAWLVIYVLLGSAQYLWSAKNRFYFWRDKKRHQEADLRLLESLAALTDKNWSHAEALLAENMVYHSPFSGLGALYSAYQQNKPNDYLKALIEKHPELSSQLYSLQIKWQLAKQENQKALETLKQCGSIKLIKKHNILSEQEKNQLQEMLKASATN